jgi:hypothetical protein
MRSRVLLLTVVLSAAVPALGQPAPAEPVPTPESAQKLIDDGKPAEGLKQVNRLLSMRGKAAEGLDRHAVLLLKAESHLRLKAAEAAAVAFRQAAAETEDKEQQALARASEQLVRKSKNLAYTPKKITKGEKAEPIDIVDPESRRKALGAMFVDEIAPLMPKVEAAKDAKTVAPMVKAVAAVKELDYLELAANGSADQVNGIVEDVKAQGKKMLTAVVEKATKRVDRITELSNDTTRVKRVMPSGRGYRTVLVPMRRGVSREDVMALKEIAAACDEVMIQAKALTEATGADEAELEELVESADDLRTHVRRMLRMHEVEIGPGRAAGEPMAEDDRR